MSDVLVVSLGTTHGLRVADNMLIAMLHEAGVSAEAFGVRMGLANTLRRGYPLNDLVEAIAARRALDTALQKRGRPRAVVFSTTTAALLATRPGIPYAVRLDSPAALNRRGVPNAPVRALERRSLARARLVIPMGDVGAAALPAGSAAYQVVPVPINSSGDAGRPRDPELAVAYTPDPKAKGLELLCAAWAQVAGASRRMEVFGIERGDALAFLARRGVAEPAGLMFRGFVPAADFRAALRTARCFVSAARWEDYGQAPLEALRDGTMLVTAPADGPYEALAIARHLDRDLVARDFEPASLAAGIDAAYRRDRAFGDSYRHRAAVRLEPYEWPACVSALRTRVLPILLGESRSA
ncbi:MAG: glycosyltransferase [Solirubrobacteraceae bacterium]